MKKKKTDEEILEQPLEQPTSFKPKEEECPVDMSKLLGAAKEFMPSILDTLKPKKKDPSTMCEFTIKGSDDFVIKCLGLILG